LRGRTVRIASCQGFYTFLPSSQMAQGCPLGIFPPAARSQWRVIDCEILAINCLMFAVKRWRCCTGVVAPACSPTRNPSRLLCDLYLSICYTFPDFLPCILFPVSVSRKLGSTGARIPAYRSYCYEVKLHLVLVPRLEPSCY
jgi:hypothetical protein